MVWPPPVPCCPLGDVPPAASTSPLGSRVKVPPRRGVVIDPVGVHRPVPGSKISAEERSCALPTPPPLSRITATTEPMTMHSPTTASVQGRRERRTAGIRGATGAAQVSHLVPTSVRTMHFGQTGLPHSTQLIRVGSPCVSHFRTGTAMAGTQYDRGC